VRYLIWDFDNTLAHRPGLWSRCLADLTNDLLGTKQLTRELFVPHLSKGFPWQTPDVAHLSPSDPDAWWANIRPTLRKAVILGAGVGAADAEIVVNQVRAAYCNPRSWVVYPDTVPALAELTARGWRHIILSNHVPELPQLVADLDLDDYFDHVLTSARVGFEKPHASAFASAVALLPPRRRTVMVGDNFVADYQGAKRAGIEAVLIRNSHPDCETEFHDMCGLVRYLAT
jgi:putative hydrolase of the HAD superfamily